MMDREFLIDLFAGFGPVTIRPMFSGFGISVDGINFALALRSGLYLRADEQTFPDFEAAGSKPFQYQTRARTVTVGSYWQVPVDLYDDADAFAQWARAALAAAQRAAVKKRAKTRKPAKQATTGKSIDARSAGKTPKRSGSAAPRSKTSSKKVKARNAVAKKPARSSTSRKGTGKTKQSEGQVTRESKNRPRQSKKAK